MNEPSASRVNLFLYHSSPQVLIIVRGDDFARPGASTCSCLCNNAVVPPSVTALWPQPGHLLPVFGKALSKEFLGVILPVSQEWRV